jgi:hypothetical protein
MNHLSAFRITALAVLGAFACSGGDATASAEDQALSLTQSLRSAPAPSYARVRRDLRRCASPACGGFFIENVNQRAQRCLDGKVSDACYVADLDLSALGLSADQESLVRSNPEEFLLDGTLQANGRQRFGQCAVSEAWHGHAGITPSGQFFHAQSSGIICITSPCPTFSADLLNRSAASFQVAEVDLARVSSDPSDGLAQLNQPEGLLLAGRRTTVRGPGGSATGLRANEYYLPFVAESQSCGGLLGQGCADGSFCNFSLDAMCGAADQTGVCAPIPEFCPEIFSPVCGCDGNTYANTCFANAAGTSVASAGECAPPAQSCGSRGQASCEDGSYCDFPSGSDCGRADAPGTCAERPQLCPDIFLPVCGCDGKTYANSCNAARAGVSVDFDGACKASASP